MNKNKKRTRRAKVRYRAFRAGHVPKSTSPPAQQRRLQPVAVAPKPQPVVAAQPQPKPVLAGDTPKPQFTIGQAIIIDASAQLPKPDGEGLAKRYRNHKAVIEATANEAGVYLIKSPRATRLIPVHQKHLRPAG